MLHCKMTRSAGDLGALEADIPELQQLSIWPEFNRVARRRLLWEAATALGACSAGGSVLLRLGDILTSFTVGVLYVLFRSFRLFAIVKPFTSCAASSEAFALFLDRAPQQPEEGDDATDSTKHLLKVRIRMCRLPAAVPGHQGVPVGEPLRLRAASARMLQPAAL